MHDKKTQVSLVLATSLLLCFPIAGTAQGGPPGGGGGGAPQTVITKAVPDLTDAFAPVIFIEGAEFGTSPTVLLGEDMGTLVDLFVASSSDTSIMADLPMGLEPASYLLVVEAGAGPTQIGMMDVTIGPDITEVVDALKKVLPEVGFKK